eukprot:366426-Chlamydomonas_euryale.AAC.5
MDAVRHVDKQPCLNYAPCRAMHARAQLAVSCMNVRSMLCNARTCAAFCAMHRVRGMLSHAWHDMQSHAGHANRMLRMQVLYGIQPHACMSGTCSGTGGPPAKPRGCDRHVRCIPERRRRLQQQRPRGSAAIRAAAHLIRRGDGERGGARDGRGTCAAYHGAPPTAQRAVGGGPHFEAQQRKHSAAQGPQTLQQARRRVGATRRASAAMRKAWSR